MKEFFITCLIGIVFGAIDVLPMIKMKLDKYSILSAFVFYFTLPFMILNLDIFHLVWWAKGIIGFVLALPMVILVAKDDKKSIIPMLVMSTVIGTLIAILGHYLGF